MPSEIIGNFLNFIQNFANPSSKFVISFQDLSFLHKIKQTLSELPILNEIYYNQKSVKPKFSYFLFKFFFNFFK